MSDNIADDVRKQLGIDDESDENYDFDVYQPEVTYADYFGEGGQWEAIKVTEYKKLFGE